MTTTANLGFELVDEATEQKATQVNETFVKVDAALSQISIAMPDANYTLSTTSEPPEWQYLIIRFTGTLTANRNIIAPLNKKPYILINDTAGGFSLTLKTAAGTGVPASNNTPRILRCDGTNIVDLFTVPSLSTITPNAQTGTTYTYVNGDNSKLVTHSNAAAIAGTLPQAGSGGNFTNGWFMFVQNRGAGTLTITPTTSTIDGAASLALTTGQGVLLCSDGTNYFTSRGVGGGGGGGSGPVFRAYRSTNQTVSAATFTKVQLNSEEFDSDAAFDSATNYRFQPATAGYYLITGGISSSTTPANRILASIYKNGVENTRGPDIQSASLNRGTDVTALVYLNGTTDYVELYGFTTGTVFEGNAIFLYMHGAFQRS